MAYAIAFLGYLNIYFFQLRRLGIHNIEWRIDCD